MERKNCLVCNSKNINKIIDLGMHPFADTFIPEDKISEPDKAYPLICDLCMNCGHTQLRCTTNPNDRYCGVDYSYTSSNSNFSRTHWEKYAEEVGKKVEINNGDTVVEVGSNDGFLTERFAKMGCKVLGVDPSVYMANLARERNVKTLTELFGRESVDRVIENVGKAKLVIANNVFNHSENPQEFARAVGSLLSKDGTFVFELPYWAISIDSGKFDQIYHEHVSYFTAKSSKEIAERAGMKVKNIEVVDYHGGSLRVYLGRSEDLREHCLEVEEIIRKEESQGLFSLVRYNEFMKDLKTQRDSFLRKIYDLKGMGEPIVAIGAAAKGNTFLNFYNLDQKTIDYVTDSSPHKQGKYTPLSRIPIRGDEILEKYGDRGANAILLSWNLEKILRPIIHKINPNIKFISPEKH